jgi:hypothetical protein
VSTDGDRQVLDLQRDALLAAGVYERHLFEDRISGSRVDRARLAANPRSPTKPTVNVAGASRRASDRQSCQLHRSAAFPHGLHELRISA